MAHTAWDQEPPRAARRIGAALAVVALFILLVFAATSASAQEPGHRGVDIYDATCAACHDNGQASLTDAELRGAIIYMASGASKRAKEPKKAKPR